MLLLKYYLSLRNVVRPGVGVTLTPFMFPPITPSAFHPSLSARNHPSLTATPFKETVQAKLTARLSIIYPQSCSSTPASPSKDSPMGHSVVSLINLFKHVKFLRLETPYHLPRNKRQVVINSLAANSSERNITGLVCFPHNPSWHHRKTELNTDDLDK
ncbi:hypothetical protein SISNIDRAFT_461237 [Sistotremastrum niveocremeum HHB9708]|uniref:Uncharacterized protein n=2 Tax=Sistotremastraceae TaxID=3402574 RepID=A0A164MXE5_9AGAM|nr:hypothetical protein SISNIDRAFT_461237 [Sistotremastrum niveocremeum HHB9708]KZT32196.1 hypothetical protein SISSUDRAFT_1123531 [Sistotremastrum suecicum HHB10207 ss-3]